MESGPWLSSTTSWGGREVAGAARTKPPGRPGKAGEVAQGLNRPSSGTMDPALRRALALFRVSSNSRVGSESRTIPAPAWTKAWEPATTTVRMVMAVSMFIPPKEK
jgi:hypothetical protein